MTRQLGTLFFLILTLSACSTLQNKSPNAGICNEAKHRIIFNAATGDPQAAMRQRAELGNLDNTYREAGCS
jgi:hypothetical protein